MKRRAFISVYDKIGLVDFASNLVDKFDYEIVSCGETYQFLTDAGIDVIDCSEFSGSLDLLPKEFSALNETMLTAILLDSNRKDGFDTLAQTAIKSFDMVIVNLQPIEEILSEKTFDNIDIVGCTLLRAAAKNYKTITVITNKLDYYVALNANEFGRLKLAEKAFSLTSAYDRIISETMAEQTGVHTYKSYNFKKIKDLPYGENTHQKAAIYDSKNLIDYEVLNAKELSYNDILNASTTLNILSEFFDVNCVAIVRNAKPSGVALGRSLYEAYTKAFDCDPVNSFYGVVGLSKTVDLEVAKHINSMSVEVVIAPDYEEKALELFNDNDHIKIIKINTPLSKCRKYFTENITLTPFGTLIEEKNTSDLNKEMFKVVTQEKPTPEQVEDAVFAWKIAKYCNSNSSIIARDLKTSAIAQGYTSIITAMENSINYACDNAKDAILASDTPIDSQEAIYSAIQNRINLIIQPGGSVKDDTIIDICNKYGIIMITTGITNYRY